MPARTNPVPGAIAKAAGALRTGASSIAEAAGAVYATPPGAPPAPAPADQAPAGKAAGR